MSGGTSGAPLRLALVGLGAWAHNIVRSLPADAGLTVTVTGRTDAAAFLPPTCDVTGDLTVLAQVPVDGVIVANAASQHVSTLRDIWRLAPAMPVFVEKPVAMSRGDLEALADEREPYSRVPLLVDHVSLFNPHAVDVCRQLSARPPRHIVGWDANRGPHRPDCPPWWDYGPHAVALACVLSGCAVTPGMADVTAVGVQASGDGVIVEVELHFRGGPTAGLAFGNGAPSRRRDYVVHTHDGGQVVFDGLRESDPRPLAAALAAFCGAVRAGGPPAQDARFGWSLPREVTRLLDEVSRRVPRSAGAHLDGSEHERGQ